MKYTICGYAENGLVTGHTLGKQGNQPIWFKAKVIEINNNEVKE